MRIHWTERMSGLADYQNWLVKMARGNYFFVLNDDAEMCTQDWDNMIRNMDLVSYGQTVPLGPPKFELPYSEFPVVGCNAVKKLGYLMPPYFKAWGADQHLYKVYSGADLIFDLKDIVFEHSRVQDETHEYLSVINDDRLVDPSDDSRRLSELLS